MPDSLETIAALREQLRIEKPKVLARAKELAEAELLKLEAALNAACKAAHDEGNSYAAIGRALGTKDFGTVKRRVGAATPTVSASTTNEFTKISDNILEYNDVAYEVYRFTDTGLVEFYVYDGQEDGTSQLRDNSSAVYRRAVEFAERNGLI